MFYSAGSVGSTDHKSTNINVFDFPVFLLRCLKKHFNIRIMEQLRKPTVKRERGFVYFPLFVLAVYAILMGHVKADCSLRRLFTEITFFFLVASRLVV